MAVLENADVLSFTIEVQDEESHDTLFAVPVTLNLVNFPAATPGFPTDAEPAYAPEVLLILPEGGYGEWQFVDGGHAAHARDGGKYLPGAGGGSL